MFEAEVYEILVASPSDVTAERKILPEVIHAWNGVHGRDFGLLFHPVLWETHSTPQLGDRPQAIINQQLVDRCDVLIGAFWTRLGTPTGEAASGTVEEIQEFRSRGKPVLLYFSSRPVALDSVDLEQYELLQAFKKEIRTEGLVEEYAETAELREKIDRHLTSVARAFAQSRGRSAPAEAPPPDALVHAMAERQLDSALRRIGAEWAAERDSEPHNLHEGKRILDGLADELLDFRTQAEGRVDPALLQETDALLRELRALSRHQVFLDGGASFHEFWTRGNAAVERVRALVGFGRPAAQEGSL